MLGINKTACMQHAIWVPASYNLSAAQINEPIQAKQQLVRGSLKVFNPDL